MQAAPRRRGTRAAISGLAAAAGLLLAGCVTDEAATPRPVGATAPVAAAPQGSTDSGRRLVGFSAPLGAVTVETPPVRGRLAEDGP